MNEQMPPAFTLKIFWIDFDLELQNFGANSVGLIYFFLNKHWKWWSDVTNIYPDTLYPERQGISVK